MTALSIAIEAVLFAAGRPLSRRELVRMLEVDAGAVDAAIAELCASPATAPRGIVAVDDGTMVELRTAPEAGERVEKIRKDEYARELGRAGQEVLSAVLYRGPLTRAEIDFIRGVNSTQTLRTLLIRGLIRRLQNPKDERSFLYEATTELLAHLGVTRAEHLPGHAEVREKLRALEEAYRAQQQGPGGEEPPDAKPA